jgi:hypothetical protein
VTATPKGDAAKTSRAVFNGSANYSPKAFKQSWENVTRYKGAAFKPVLDAFRGRFQRLFDAAQTAADLPDAPPSCPS